MKLFRRVKSELYLLLNLLKRLKYFEVTTLIRFYVLRILKKNKIYEIRIKLDIGNKINVIKLYIRPFSHDICAVLEVLCDNIYLSNNQLVEYRYKRILDIGAHIGTFTVLSHYYFNPELVVAVEPDRENIKILKKNIQLNGVRAHILCGAIDSKTGITEFYIRKNNDGPIRTTTLKSGALEIRRVKSIALDELIDKYKIDFIKMDCEGAEFKALLSSKQLCKIKAIVMEYHKWGGNPEDLVKFLRDLGFKILYIKDCDTMGILHAVQE